MIPESERRYWFTYACKYVNTEYTDMYCQSTCSPLKCRPLDFDTNILFPPKVVSEVTPSTINQQFHSDMTMDFFGHPIQLSKTRRTFSAEWDKKYEIPTSLVKEGSEYKFCARKDRVFSATISEDCVVEAATLHYLDIANRVLLYRTCSEYVRFSAESAEYATFYLGGNKATVGAYHKMLLPLPDEAGAEKNGHEEWWLIIGDEKTLISTADYRKRVLPWYGPQVFDDFSPCDAYGPSGAYSVILLPPPANADLLVPHDREHNHELYCNGWYNAADMVEDALSGGFLDFFYPVWCRSLITDPVWKQAAAMRSRAGASNPDYTPPAPNVSPIPTGAFARHPIVGSLYQFLVRDAQGRDTVVSSSEAVEPLVTDNLTNRGVDIHKQGHTLLYPISLIGGGEGTAAPSKQQSAHDPWEYILSDDSGEPYTDADGAPYSLEQ